MVLSITMIKRSKTSWVARRLELQVRIPTEEHTSRVSLWCIVHRRQGALRSVELPSDKPQQTCKHPSFSKQENVILEGCTNGKVRLSE